MHISCSKNNQGSALIVTMIFVIALGGILYSYLKLVQNSELGVARAQTWNAALPIAEAGIEEGLACLNSGGSFSTLSHHLDGGTYYVSYHGGTAPYLISTGAISAPVTGQLISRAVRVDIQKPGLFSKGLVALNNIDMNGHSIASSSWNSHDPSESYYGLYNGYLGTNGDVASVNGFVDLGNQTILGSLFLGPNASYDNSGTISGTIYTDANLQYNDIRLPQTDTNGNAINWQAAPTSNYDLNGKNTEVHNLTTSGYYIISDSTPVVVQPGINVTLDVRPSNWDPSSLDILGGTSDSANVAMYVESSSITLNGNSAGGASGNRPENLVIFGLPSLTNITFGGTSYFVGAIYAPGAPASFNGGGHSYNFMGALVCKSFTMNGHFGFHYDTSLAARYASSYVVGSWQEL